MPIYSVQGPDGRIHDFEGPEGASQQQVLAFAAQHFAELPNKEEPKSGLGAAFERGLESYLSPSLTALQGATPESALAGLERAKHLEETNPSQASLAKVKEAFKKGVLPGIGEVVREVPYALAEQAPNLASMGVGARLGAMAGAPFGGVGAIGGGALGALAGQFAASYLPQAGGNIEEQAQTQQERGQPININALKAYGTAVPMAAADVGLMHFIGGRGLMSRLLGTPEEILAKKSATEVEKLAQEKLLPTLLKGTAKGFAAEVPTEILQDILQRAQAGEDLTSPDALQGYGETAYQMGLLSPLGAFGRLSEKAEARGQLQTKQLEEQKQQQIQALKDQQAAEEAEAKRKQDPAYMAQFVQNYETLQDQYKELQKQTKKPDMKTALPSDIEQYNQNREQLSALRKQLAADSQEYLQLRPQYNQLKAQQTQQAQAAENQRYQQMELAGAQNQPTADTAYYQAPQGTLPGIQPAINPVTGEPVAKEPEKADPRKLYERVQALQQAKDEHQQQENEIVANGDPEAYEAFVTRREAVDKAHADAVKELKEAGGYTPEPKHPSVVAQDAYNKAVEKWQQSSGAGTPGYDPEKAAKLYPAVKAAKEHLEQVVNQYGVAPRGGEQMGFDFGPKSEFKEQHITSKEEAAAKRYKPGAAQAESEEQAYLEEQRRQEEQAREEARFQPTFWRNKQEDLNEMGRISEREGPEMDFSLRPPETPGGTAAMGQMQQNLQGIKPGEGLLHTAEERAPARKSPTEPYRGLYASSVEGPEYQADRARLEERLARVMSDHEMPQETYALLRRAEEALAVPNPDPTFMRTLDEQLTEIESGREGMPRKGAPVGTQKLQALPIGQTAVSKIVPKENVLRGPSAKVKPLSRQAELEEQLRTSEQARGEGPVKEKQLSLFPEEEEKLGTVRANPAQFQRFLNSDKVKKLRQSLDKDLGELQKLSTVDELRSRVEELTKQVNAMESVNLEYKQAQQTIRHQRDVGKQRHDVTQLSQALVSGVLKRMDLQGKLDELIKERTEIEQQAKANSIGGWEGYDPDLFANLNHVQEQYQNAVNEVAVMQGALSTLEGRLKVEEAKIKIAKLNPLTTPKAAFEAAKKELEAAREDLGRAQKEASAEILANKDREARERRAREAIQDAETKRLNDQIARARQTRLEAMYGESVRGTEYPMIEEARRLAREDIEQERYRKPAESKEEQSARANPNGYLAYLRGQITKLEKVMQNAYQTSNEARMKPIEELRKKADALNKQYRETESADAREKMLPRIEAAEKEYDEAVDRMSVMPLTWKGMAKQQNDLRKLYIAAERIEDRIQAGDLVQPEARRAPPTKKKEPKNQVAKAQKVVNELKDKLEGLDVTQEDKRTNLESRLLKATDVLNKAKEAEAAKNKVETKAAKERATAPKPSEKPLTKTDIKEATQQGGTVYTGKGVGEELQSKVAKEVKTKEIVENENKYKELKAKKPSELNAMQKAFIAMYEYKYGGEKTGLADKILSAPDKGVFRTTTQTGAGMKEQEVQRLADRILGDWAITPEVKIVADEKGLPQAIQDQAAKDGVTGQIPGVYDPNTKTVYLVANNLHTGEDVALTIAHEVAGHFGLREMLGDQYKSTMDDIYNGNESVREKADAKMAQNKNLSQQVATEEVLADLAETGPTAQDKSAFRQIIDAIKKWFRDTFGIPRVTDEEVRQIVANARKYVQEGKGGKGGAVDKSGPVFRVEPKYNNADYANIGAIADKFIAKEKTFAEKIKANATGLAFETQLVDRFAGFERLAKTMEALKGSQMMYYLRMYDQRMNFVSQSVANGALRINEKVRADGRKEYIIESKAGPSLKSTVQILKEATPIVGNGEAVNRLFTLYMSAIRAKDKGFDALHFGNNITEAELNQAKRTIDADPKLKDIFDRARDQYNQYNRDQVNFAVQSGAFSKELAARLLKENDYIPWYRQRNGVAELIIGNENPIRVGSIAEQPYLQELVGGDAPILDFMTSSVQNTNMIADMGLRNLATKNAVFELMDMDLAHISKKKISGPDVVKFKVDGEDRYAIVETDKVGVPADILIKGMEGIPTQMPFALRIMGIPAKLLRKTVTASPLYAAKQLFRDSLAAPILAGADFTPVLGSLKEINSATKATLEQRGITGGQVFTGTNEDLSKILKDIVNDKPGWLNSLSKWEAMSMEADATTRRAQYNSYIQQGLSEMEATLMSLESMNFNKRGASPSIHIVNSLIPFFNAQIQSLNVLYKALTGKLPFSEKLKIQEKLLTRGAMMAAGTLAYAMMMQDDEAYKNATPDQKYNNWFVRVPGVDEPVRLPIPFEVGYIFKALPEALYNTMVNKHGGEEAVEAFSGIMKNLIPGGTSYGIPQALKPAIEAGLGKSFYTGRDILTQHEKSLLPEEQFRANTTEAAKAFGKATGSSPIIIDELVRGYTGTLGLAFLQAVSMGIPKGASPEQTAMRLSEMPVIGGAFQPNDAGGIISNVYDRMDNIKKVANTVDALITKGHKAEALDLVQRTGNAYAASEVADYYTSTMKELTSYENAVRASNLTPEEKRKKLDEIKQNKIKFANTVRDATDKTVHQ